ncbi:MAG: FliH/SctL family protein [Pirellulales bacterium]
MASIIKASEPQLSGAESLFRLDELVGDSVAPGGSAASRAADVLAQAQRQAGEIRRRAEEEGRAAGLLVAEQLLGEKIDRHLATSICAFDAAVARIHAAHDEWLAHWERSAVHVAVKIAERVIRRQVDRTPEITLDLVREALELSAGSADIQLRMHPDDVETLGHHAQRLANELARLGKVDLVSDPAIAKGGCRVDTRFGTIDQQFTSQLTRIENELT